MNNDAKARAVRAFVSIGGIINASQVHQLLKFARWRIAQGLHDAEVIACGNCDCDFAQGKRDFADLIAQNLNEVLLELFGVN